MLAPSSNVSPTDDVALSGHDPTPRLVAVQPLPPGGETGHAMMRVHQRCETGTGLHTEDVPFYPFFFLTDIHLLHGFQSAFRSLGWIHRKYTPIVGFVGTWFFAVIIPLGFALMPLVYYIRTL